MTNVLICDVLITLFIVVIPILVVAYAIANSEPYSTFAYKIAILLADCYPFSSNIIAIVFITPYRRRVAQTFRLSRFRKRDTAPSAIPNVAIAPAY